MRIANSVLLACALATFLMVPTARSEDTEAQAKARAALRQQMNQPMAAEPGNSQQTTQAPMTSPARLNDPEAEAKARAALHQRMNGTAAQPGDSEQTAKARQAERQKLDEIHADFGYGPITSPLVFPPRDSDADHKLRELLRQKTEQPGPMASTPAMATKPAPPKPGVFPPMQGPPSTLSPAKQQKLTELLQRYKADELTPEQYHLERAKILSEP